MWKQIFVGLLVSGLGGLLMYFSQQLVDLLGPIARAEQHMSSTRSAYVLGGFVIIILGCLMLFGVIPVDSPVGSTTSLGIS